MVDEAPELARDNMTAAEWLTILEPAKKDGISLPQDYNALYECLCTYAGKLWTKFGESCQHYIKVEDIVRVMEFRPVKDAR